jgi:penicillin-binding protein 1A
VFGNGGLYYTPYSYYEVRDAEDKVILKPDENGQRVISEGTADVMNHMLQAPVTYSNGTANGYGVSGFTTFAKTGTSSDNYDKWMVGGTPYYVCAAWVGYKDRQAININLFGTYPAAKVFKYVMNLVHEDLEEKEFEYSSDSVRRSYCTVSGMLASSRCASTNTGWYKIDNLPGTCTICGSRTEPVENNDPEARF